MKTARKCRVCESDICESFIKTFAQMHDSREEFNFDRCQICGYVFLNSPVEKSVLMNYYTEYYLPYRGAKAWGKYAALVEKSDRKLNETRAAWLAEYGKINEKSSVLDVGCGKPEFLRECVKKYDCRAFGLDFTDEGWRNDGDKFEKINLKVGEIGDLPPDLQFDFVTMWHYLEHDYNPAKTLREIVEKSHQETILMIEVPDFESASREKFGKFWAGFHTPRHVSVFSENNLKILLEKNGWEIIKLNRYGTLDPFVLHWMSAMEQKGIAWNKNMEDEFWRFVFGMIKFFPQKLRQKTKPLGIMTVIARPARNSNPA